MAVPTPAAVEPWYLRNINQALELDSVTGQVHVRSSIVGGNITIAGNIIVSNVTVDAMGNLDLSGNSLPVYGNFSLDPGQIIEVTQGTDPWMVEGNVAITNTPDVTGNVVITNTPDVTGNIIVTGNVDANITGGNVTVQQGTDPWNIAGNVGISGTATVSLGTDSLDAFGRLRVSNPVTLFDTQNRYFDHQLFASNTAVGGTYTYNANSTTFAMAVGTSNNASVISESYKVFSYQPGKSLLIYATFCMATPIESLRQRVGYFSAQNGVFFETNGTTYNMVIRSYSSGSVVEDRIPQSIWNGDRLNGAGGANNPSGLTLYPDRTQIFFCDIEWLGVGSVRVGFIIDGQYINCHTFNHANQPGNTTTYMSTACLPIRYEITNTGITSGSSTMRQICSTVISEGGYTLSGIPTGIGHNLGSSIVLPNDLSFKPLLSIRLKSSNPDAIVLPTDFSIVPVDQAVVKYRIYTGAVTSGGSWVSAGTDSSVEYNLSPTTLVSGHKSVESFLISNNQSVNVPQNAGFEFADQLTRDSFTGTMYEYVIMAATTGTNIDVYASINWQEVS